MKKKKIAPLMWVSVVEKEILLLFSRRESERKCGLSWFLSPLGVKCRPSGLKYKK